MKKQLFKVFAHPASLPTITALYGVAAGYVVGVKRAEKNGIHVGGDVTLEEARANPDQYVIKFPDLEGEQPLLFDRPPKKQEAEEATEEVTPEDRAKILQHLGRITEVKEDEGGTVVTTELTEEGAQVVHEIEAEADAQMDRLARSAMSTYGADETEVDNIFESPHGEWNYEEEAKNRGPRDPYVIHVDEFQGEESGFRQAQLTYYAGDDVMTDEDDQPVFNFEEIVGPLMWGHGSNNGDLFFVRNPRLEAEYEITRSYESYAHAILGIEAEEKAAAEEVRHSRRLPRLSQYD